jgi:formate/nitrite transporter FocA (FNT family)
MLTYGYMASLMYFLCSFTAVSLMGLGYAFQGWILHVCRQMAKFGIEILPHSVFSWGITAIAAAFVLLGIGSVLSLRRTAGTDPPPRP